MGGSEAVSCQRKAVEVSKKKKLQHPDLCQMKRQDRHVEMLQALLIQSKFPFFFTPSQLWISLSAS